MSNDPRINSALFNFCLSVDDGPKNPSSEPVERASKKDLEWLKQVMESVEAPDRAMQRCVKTLGEWIKPVEAEIYAGILAGQKHVFKPSFKVGQKTQEQQQQPLLLGGAITTSTSSPAAATTTTTSTDAAAPNAAKTSEVAEKRKTPLSLMDLPKITDEVLDAAEEICDMVEDINFAKEFMLMKGVPLYLGLIRTSIAANPHHDSKISKADFIKLQAQWSQLRTIFIRSLAGSSANFEEFQTEMCKFEFSDVFLPLLTKWKEFGSHFPAELSAIMLCVTNTVRQHDIALQMFLYHDGMYHFANLIEHLASNSHPTSSESVHQHFIVAKRRAFNFAKYLVEEQAVTSPRVLKASVDVLIHQAKENLAAKKTKKSDNEDDAKENQAEERDFENSNMAAAYAASILTSALERTIISEKAKREETHHGGGDEKKPAPKETSSVELVMPQWGPYLVSKVSQSSFWDNFSNSNNNVIEHHELKEAVMDFVKVVSSIKKKIPSIAGAFEKF